MRLKFLGAVGMVTGSCYLLEAGGLRLLLDCGLFQGKEEDLNREPFEFSPATLDGVILSHAHIDHSGRLPLLRKHGFRGPIYTHPATADLAQIMLLDSAGIQEADVERENRKNRRAGRPLVEPLYSKADAIAVAEQFRPVPYDQIIDLNSRLQLRLRDAGHILGSAIIELWETDPDGQKTKMVLTGDLGQPNRPILRDPVQIEETDYLVLESTYGNRLHEPVQSVREKLAEVIRNTIGKGGNVVIPSFAVGRTQEILYDLNALKEAKQLPPDLKIVLDSPLAISATEVTRRHAEIFDEETRALLERGDDPFIFPGLVMSATADESRALNESKQPMVIVAAGGMCEAGRVVHHLKHNLWRPTSTILFVGFQAEGTLGRRILDGASRVKIHGEEIVVRARIESLQGLSAHADQTQLLAFADGLKRLPLKTILVHGEADGRSELARLLMDRGHRVDLPVLGEEILLAPAWQVSAPAAPVRRKGAQGPTRVAVAQGAALALSAQRMAAVLRELQAVRKAWNTNGPHLPAEQAEELAKRAEEMLRQLGAMRRLIESASEE